MLLLQAGHGGQAALGNAQDGAHGVILGRTGQSITAGLAPQAGEVTLLHQPFYDGLQIFFRDVLPIGDLL